MLYIVTDRNATGGRPLASVVEAALRGGATLVQLREKDLPTRELAALAITLREVTGRYGAQLLINERVDVALASRADGVHLPTDSFAIGDARKVLGPGRTIATSTHSLDEARAAERAGADFVVFGPVYDTPSKRSFGPPQGVERLREVAAAVGIPVVAIGGIDVERVAPLAWAKCSGLAAIRAIMSAPDPEAAARRLVEAWSASR